MKKTALGIKGLNINGKENLPKNHSYSHQTREKNNVWKT
jgi:hypothetical protein